MRLLVLLVLLMGIVSCGNVKTPDVVMREELTKLDQLIVEFKNKPKEEVKNTLGEALTEEAINELGDILLTYYFENEDKIVEFLIRNEIVIDTNIKGW